MAKGKPKSNSGASVKRKEPPKNATTSKGKKRRKTNGKRIAAAPSSTKGEIFYYGEGDPKDSCNLLIQKRLVHSSEASHKRFQTVPFEYRSGTHGSKSFNGRIPAKESNLLVGQLNPRELQMWSSFVGAAYAARGFPPANIARRLGRITRRIWLPVDPTKKIPGEAPYHPWHENMTKTMKKRTPHNEIAKPPSLTKVEKELLQSQPFEPGEKEEDRTLRLASTAKQLVRSWGETANRVGKILPNWNQHGEIPIVPVVRTNSAGNEENSSSSNSSNGISSKPNPPIHTSSVVTIRNMLESKLWKDDTDFAPSEKELYHLKIPTDTLSVLKALEALSNPDPALYGLPLVLGIPILEPAMPIPSSSRNTDWRPFRLTISVYAHRMLFECMTAGALRTVMAALDEERESVTRPLVKSPAEGPIAFGKDPDTKIEMEMDHPNEDGPEIIVIDDDILDSDDTNQSQTRTSDTLDAFSTEGFLKLIENQGVSGIDTVYKHKIEPVLYGKDNKKDTNDSLLGVSLLPHQVHGVCWMYQMETLDEGVIDGNSKSNPSLGLNGLLWERRRFHEGDTYYYSPALGQARLAIGEGGIGRRARKGGILADEMGLGKTVQALALVLATLDDLRREKANREEMEKSNRDSDNDNDTETGGKYVCKRHSHATLIIVPPALVGQWMNEIKKITGGNLLVQFLDHKDKNFRLELNPSADIVLTTYQALEANGKKASREHKLSSIIWGRIILDEMQEVRSWNTAISKTCQQLQSDRRWMLSGTPLWEGINDFKGELCFLGLDPFAANNEDGFFNFAITNHWNARSKHALEILRILSLVMLRRTKSMSILESGLPLLGLKKLNLIFEPVPQDPAERALYCFLESVMHSIILINQNTSTKTRKKQNQNRVIFLRLLRELCISPYLINGGLGCSSQLGVLNRLMKEYNRLQLANQDQIEQHGNDRVYSCDEAIQFLSQVEDVARTDSDFVTDTRLGGGGGISRRNRALLINPQEQIDSAREKIAKSAEMCKKSRSTRAKAWWHRALEGVTTGRLKDKSCYDATSPSVSGLWNWRNQVTCVKPTTVLSFLNRGFRPTDKYFGFSGSATNRNTRRQTKIQREREEKLIQLGKRQPVFRWAHPFAFLFSHIPIQVSDEQFQEFIQDFIDLASLPSSSSSLSSSSHIIRLRESPRAKTRDVIVQFSNGHDFDHFEKCVKKVDGVELKIQQQSRFVDKKEITAAKANYQEAEAMFKVHPCETNERNLAKAKSAYKKSKLGLRILDKAHHRAGQVLCSRAFGTFRGSNLKTWDALFRATMRQIKEATTELADNEIIVNQQEKTIKSMERKIQLNVAGTGVENLNTIDGLQALKNGEADKTNCPICFDNLGEGECCRGKVALTRCGHMSCKSCLSKWMDQKQAEGVTMSCIECRKPIRYDQLIFVDPKKVDTEHLKNKKKEAHDLVRQAAKMLEENYGQLTPDLWEALYLVIDLPSGINQNHHGYFTAIPGLFLGHLRHAMANCLPIESSPNQRSLDLAENIPLPSKFRALLADLPRNELSVVFASSKSIVRHLQFALEREGFVCKALFVGQSEKESETAISDWESPSSENGGKKAATVLIVQAGAAACGLTLTAASKMFIIEPFRKHEEEKQAYARLHRFGQKKTVSCKVYYTPVSIESRLLEWRRRAKSHTREEEKTVYAPLRHSNVENDDDNKIDDASVRMMEGNSNYNSSLSEDEDERKDNSNSADDIEAAAAEEDQTRFLLGLNSSSAEAETPETAVEEVEARDDRYMTGGSAESPIELSP